MKYILYVIKYIYYKVYNPSFKSPLQSKARLTFEFITWRVLSNREIPYQARRERERYFLCSSFEKRNFKYISPILGGEREY